MKTALAARVAVIVRAALTAAFIVWLAPPVLAGGDLPASAVGPRVAHHVRLASALADRLEPLLDGVCPRFASPGEWEAFVEREIDDAVLLVAHVEEAWSEAKTTPDDDVRRAGKAPGRRLRAAVKYADKLQACAESNGSRLDTGGLWQRIELAVARRRAEIALPR